MSVTTSYRRLPKAEFARLQNDSQYAEEYFGWELEDDDFDDWSDQRRQSGRWLNIHKAGPGLHFLLTGDADMKSNTVAVPLSYMTVGGTDTEWPATYGMVSYLPPEQVREVVAALLEVREPELRARYDPTAFNAERIYPGGDQWDERGIDELLEALHQVTEFFGLAAQAGDVVLISND